MEISILDKQFKIKGIIDDVLSFQWIERYYNLGSFTFQIRKKHLDLVLNGSYVFVRDSKYTGIIYGVQCRDADIIISGAFLERLFQYRVIDRPRTYTGSVENVMRNIVNDYCIAPPGRRIDKLQLGSTAGLGETITASFEGQTVLEALETLSMTHDMSFVLNYDFEKDIILFEVFQGLDRTQEQSVNPWCVFSLEFDNVLNERYTLERDARNYIYVHGEENIIVEIDLTNGDERKELFVDATNLRRRAADGSNMPLSEYQAALRQRGLQRAAEFVDTEVIDMDVHPANAMPFALGDICAYINNELGIIVEDRITEIRTIIENGQSQRQIILGRDQMTIVQKLRREIR